MVSNRARKGRDLGTRLNDHEQRITSAEAKARTPDVDPEGTETRLSDIEAVLEDLTSSNFRAADDAPALREIFPSLKPKQVTDWNNATEVGFYWSETGAANNPAGGPAVGVVITYGPDSGTTARVMQEVWSPQGQSEDYGVSWRRVAMTGTTSWTPWAEASGGGTPVGQATESTAGIAMLAGDVDARNGLDHTKIMTPKNVFYALRYTIASPYGYTKQVTNWNDVSGEGFTDATNGFYYSQGDALNRPPGSSTSHYFGVVMQEGGFVPPSAGWTGPQLQVVHEYNESTNTIATWSRPRSLAGTPGTWRRVDGGGAADATTTTKGLIRIATTNEAVLNPSALDTVAMTPAKVKSAIDMYAPVVARGQNSKQTTDWNAVLDVGFYYGNSATNSPAGSSGTLFCVVHNSSAEEVSSSSTGTLYQQAWEIPFIPTPTNLEKRWSRIGTWNGSSYTWTTWVSELATNTKPGTIKVASNSDVAAGTATDQAVTPASLASLVSTTSAPGIIQTATDSEVLAGVTGRAVTAASLALRTATEDRTGLVELATLAETIQGSDLTKAVTPAGVAALPGYRYMQTVVFTSSGTFTKASYPNMRAVLIRLVGGGGAGAGAAAGGSGTHTGGGGGGGGGYAETFVLASSLAASETVTVGAGATGSTGSGATGNASSFGSFAAASGGVGGTTSPASALYITGVGGAGGIGTTGSILVAGQTGEAGGGNATLGKGGAGGGTVLGGGGVGAYTGAGSGSQAGAAGRQYGGGGGGAMSNSYGAAQNGGAGAAGVVIVEVYG